VPSLSLVFCGLLMVASASLAVSVKDFGSPFHFFLHQFVYVIIGVGLAVITSKISLAKWQKWAPFLLLLTVLGLVLVLLPGIGKHINGAKRWIGLGFFHLQVSEFAKLAMMVYVASYLTRRHDELHASVWGFIKPLLVLGLFAFLLLLEPDFGATTVIVLVTMGMMFLAGAPLQRFSVLVAIAFVMLASLIYFAPYRVERVLNFLDPWNNAYNGGYQLTQALMAFGRGGVFGVGLGNSVQKLFYLPEAHTDFLFAVIGEELGFCGCMAVVGLYVALIGRVLYLGRRCLRQESWFAAYLAYGLALWLAAQSFINIGVNVGILPTKGLTLPFISYGGSSLLVSSIALGLLLRIAQEAKNPTMPTFSASRSTPRTPRRRRKKRST
jgi:cell division protein FtsW